MVYLSRDCFSNFYYNCKNFSIAIMWRLNCFKSASCIVLTRDIVIILLQVIVDLVTNSLWIIILRTYYHSRGYVLVLWCTLIERGSLYDRQLSSSKSVRILCSPRQKLSWNKYALIASVAHQLPSVRTLNTSHFWRLIRRARALLMDVLRKRRLETLIFAFKLRSYISRLCLELW